MTRIGFIGLGHMGLPMATNLVKAGHQVTGFDLQASALQALVKAGGHAAESLSQLVESQDAVITMLQTGQQVEQVCLSEQGIYPLMKGCLHIDCSSIDVDTSRRLHETALIHGIISVDAPVSGGVIGAAAGSLTFMVGGDAAAFAAAQPVLSAMGKKIFHTGKAGSGQAAKICNNMILGVSMIAVAEAFVLAEKLGLSADKLYEVVNNSSGQCWTTTQYLPVPGILPNVPASHDYQPGFAAAMMLKDLKLSQQSADQAHITTTMGALATKLYEQFNQQGFGHLDFSAIIQTIK